MSKVDFKGSWALVTGASSGIGAEFARQLAHRGANLILTARSKDRLARLADDIGRVNGTAIHSILADLAEPDGIRALLSGLDALDVSIEHVVSNAGFGAVGPFITSDARAQREMVRVNVEAVMAIARHSVPHLVALGRGGIIHVASTAAYQPTPLMATYGASKAFVLSFSLALAEELRGTGVRCLALCPGPVPTGFQRTAGIEQASVMRAAKLEASAVVEQALAGYDAEKTVVVPGTLNGIQTTAVKFLPRGLVARATRMAMKRMGRG